MINALRMAYLIAAGIFVAGVTAQVFLAGMVVVASQIGWSNHINLGHMLALPLVVMLATAYLGRLPGSLKQLTWLLFAIYILQADVIIFLRDSAPVISAFHLVLALADFGLGLILFLRARQLIGHGEETLARNAQRAPNTTI